jgi:replicative DNA helicase
MAERGGRKGKDWERARPAHPGTWMPHHGDAEASILGGILLSNEALAYVANLETEDFYDQRHRVVFTAIRNLEAALRPIDIVTLEAEIEKIGKLDAIGGVAFLGELTLKVPTVDNVEDYARIVHSKRVTRDVMVMISDVLAEARADGREGDQLVHDFTTALLSIRSHGDRPIQTIAELIAEEAQRVEDDLAARAEGRNVIAGIPTGITLLDEYTAGAPRAIPTLVIGRPAMGKTTVAMHLASSAVQAGYCAMIASYEDRGQSFGQRGLGQISGVATDLIRARRLTLDDMIAISASKAGITARTELFLAASGMTAEALVRRVRRENLRRRHAGQPAIAELLVDYVQKIPQPDGLKGRDEGISHISNVLSASAVNEDMALVVFAQLNREVEKRDDHRPRLADIRESGSLEQDGKLVLALYRPWVYEPNKHAETHLEILVLKNHNGAAHQKVDVHWDVKRHRFFNTPLEAGASAHKAPFDNSRAKDVKSAAVKSQRSMADYDGRFDGAPLPDYDEKDWNRS